MAFKSKKCPMSLKMLHYQAVALNKLLHYQAFDTIQNMTFRRRHENGLQKES
jgi:hypothetical protein